MTAERRPGGARGPVTTVSRLQASARLAEPAPELRRARARAVRGEVVWRRRLERYEHGDTMIVALTARAVIERAGERPQPLHYCHEAVWIDRETAPRALAERLRELARREFAIVAAGLRDRGVVPTADDEAIAVELSVDSSVVGRLSSPTTTAS
jgi:hypothetical protein